VLAFENLIKIIVVALLFVHLFVCFTEIGKQAKFLGLVDNKVKYRKII
jgi:hypothetical protein